jgi:hypothetical protein
MTVVIMSSETLRELAASIIAEEFSARFVKHLSLTDFEEPDSRDIELIDRIIEPHLDAVIDGVTRLAKSDPPGSPSQLKPLIDEAARQAAFEYLEQRPRSWT